MEGRDLSASDPPDLEGFPLADHAEEPASKADLFFIASALFRICTMQSMALRSLLTENMKSLEEEIEEADEVLDELYALLQSDRNDEHR